VTSTTRDRLLDAGLACFATKGVDGTPIVELEERAGLASGSGGFYRYFRTKDDLLEAVVRREIERVEATSGDPTRPQPDASEVAGSRRWLVERVSTAFDLMDSLEPLVAILARERDRIPGLAALIAGRLVADGAHRGQRTIATALGTAVDAGGSDAPGAVLLSAVVGFHLSAQYFGGSPTGIGREEFVDALVDLVLGPDAP
jgi:AcrR family transcriptional regulator